MGEAFAIGDVVFMPGAPRGWDTLGRVFDIRDHGIEIWVETLNEPKRVYYTTYEQLKLSSVLDKFVQGISDDGG
jgi:hypothetical protein